MLVMMALITTMMTNPVLNLLGVADKSTKNSTAAVVSSA
jgi:hypothetical protein